MGADLSIVAYRHLGSNRLRGFVVAKLPEPRLTARFFRTLSVFSRFEELRRTRYSRCPLPTGHWPLPTAHCILLFFRRIVFNNYKNYNYKEKRYELAESP